MEKEFKKVFFGYDIEETDKRIIDLEHEYEKAYEDYQRELSRLKNQSVELENEIAKIKTEMDNYDGFSEELSKIVSDAYFKSSEMIHDTKERLEEKLSVKRKELEEIQNKNTEIKNSVKILLTKLENIMNEKDLV